MADSAIGGAMQNVSVESGKGMGSATKGAGGEKDKGETEMFRVNQIYYRMIPTLSLVAKRTLLQNYAQKNTYTGTNDTIVFIFNTGEYYVSMSSSYLYMQLGIIAATAGAYHNIKALIAQGNAMSLFEEITFISSSGTEVCRELNKGTHAAFDYYYNNTQEYIDTIGQIQGAPTGKYYQIHDGVTPCWSTIGTDAEVKVNQNFPNLEGYDAILRPYSGAAAKAVWGQGCTNLNRYSQPNGGPATPLVQGTNYNNPVPNLVEVVIPMDQILGLFKPYMNALFPAALLAGSRLEFRLKNLSESLQMIGAAVQSNPIAVPPVGNAQLAAITTAGNNILQINRIYLTLDAFQLGENVLKRLNEVSAGEDGLSMLFNTYDHVLTNTSAAGTQEVMVSQARSRIIRSWNVVRNNMFLNNNYINSFAAECAEVNRVAAQIPSGSVMAANTAVANITTTGWGGGLTYRMVLANGADSKTTPVSGTLVETILEKQPKLPSDSGLARGPTVSSYQAQLGALFFPQQPITTLPEHYQNALYVMCKSIPDKDNNCSVTYQDFLGGQGGGLYAGMYPLTGAQGTTPIDPTIDSSHTTWVAPYGLAIYGMLAEKSQALQLSGLPISNARLLKHKFVFAQNPAIGTTRTINTFTEYTRVCKVFMGGRVVVRE